MRKTFLLIAILFVSLFSTVAFALDPVWKLYSSGPDGSKYYWDRNNSYYKNGNVIVWTMSLPNPPITLPSIGDLQGFTYDKGISKLIYPCDNTQTWYESPLYYFYFMGAQVYGNSNFPKVPFIPGDPTDKLRIFFCTNLKPVWELP